MDSRNLDRLNIFHRLLLHELMKASQATKWFSLDDGNNKFSGTSYTGLVSLPMLKAPICSVSMTTKSIGDLLAELYLLTMERDLKRLGNSIPSRYQELYVRHGLYQTVHMSSKFLSQALGLMFPSELLSIDGFRDCHSLAEEAPETAESFLMKLRERLNAKISLGDITLADSTYPSELAAGKRVLGTSNTNSLLHQIAESCKEKIEWGLRKLWQVDSPQLIGPQLVCSDTDNSYRYYVAAGYAEKNGDVFIPGPTLLGATGNLHNVDVFRIARIALCAQMVTGNSIHSDITRIYNPFCFFSVLPPDDLATGLVPKAGLSDLRYEGNISPKYEYENPVVQKKITRLLYGRGVNC